MECLELVQTTVDETDVIPWLTQLIQLFFFIFFWPQLQKNHWKTLMFTLSCTRQTAGWRIHIAFGRRPQKKTKPTPEAANQWSGRPGGCTLAGQLAKFRAQLQENGLARIAKSGTKQNYLTDVLHPPPLFVFPSVPKMACGAACVDGWDRKGEKWDEMRWN